jgi:hypothetical protein
MSFYQYTASCKKMQTGYIKLMQININENLIDRIDDQEHLKNQLKKICPCCSVQRLVAYWDEELEYYLYLEEEEQVICSACIANT